MPNDDKPDSDEYGFAAAARVGLDMFDISSRQTGRTLRLIERVQDGDQIVVCEPGHANEIKRLLREARKTRVDVIVVPLSQNPLSRVGTALQGRTFFEHEFVRRHIDRAILNVAAELQTWQAAMSKTWPKSPPAPDSRAAGNLNQLARLAPPLDEGRKPRNHRDFKDWK